MLESPFHFRHIAHLHETHADDLSRFQEGFVVFCQVLTIDGCGVGSSLVVLDGSSVAVFCLYDIDDSMQAAHGIVRTSEDLHHGIIRRGSTSHGVSSGFQLVSPSHAL